MCVSRSDVSEFVEAKKEQYLKLDHKSMGVWEAIELLDTLVELETAVANVNAEPKPDLVGIFSRLDELTAALTADAPRDLLHYLHKKSFQKARLFLQGQDPEQGECPH